MLKYTAMTRPGIAGLNVKIKLVCGIRIKLKKHHSKELNMLKSFLSLIILFAVAVTQAVVLEIAESEMRSYKAGEKVTFTVTAKDRQGQKLTAGKFNLMFRDSGRNILRKSLPVDLSKNNPLTVTAELDHPGFIFIQPTTLIMPDGSKKGWVRKTPEPYGGAAVEPEKIRAATEKPADFDQFWSDGTASYRNVPVEVVPAPEIKQKNYKCFKVTVKFPDQSGAVYGFLAIPLKPGKYPAVVSVPGAGPGAVMPYSSFAPDCPVIRLAMNVHPFPAAATMDEQRKLYKEYNSQFAPLGYWDLNAENRDKYFYRNVWLAINRAVDHVASLEEFNGKNMAVTGGSQGGGTALVLAYLNKNITCAVANAPAFCDLKAWKAGRQSGWPKLHDKLNGKADNVAPYFDNVNFALGIRVPVLISVGYVDPTCPPASIYAAYNNLPGVKEIVHMYRTGHSSTPEMRKKAIEFLNKYMK